MSAGNGAWHDDHVPARFGRSGLTNNNSQLDSLSLSFVISLDSYQFAMMVGRCLHSFTVLGQP